jgi:hypothetical protein
VKREVAIVQGYLDAADRRGGGLEEEEERVDPLGFAKPPERPFWHTNNAVFDVQWNFSAAL